MPSLVTCVTVQICINLLGNQDIFFSIQLVSRFSPMQKKKHIVLFPLVPFSELLARVCHFKTRLLFNSPRFSLPAQLAWHARPCAPTLVNLRLDCFAQNRARKDKTQRGARRNQFTLAGYSLVIYHIAPPAQMLRTGINKASHILMKVIHLRIDLLDMRTPPPYKRRSDLYRN